MKKLLLVLLVCVNSLYAESDGECLGIDFISSRPPKKVDSEFLFFARARMIDTAKKFGIGICLDYYGVSPKIEIMEAEWFDLFFQQIEKIGNTDSSRCYTTNRRKQLKKDIEAYVVSQPKGKSKVNTCLRLYDSPDYHSEIERIVKKYCKDCK
ncbi:hypothetical protein LS70_009675 [Helicobacter sp. MIT 11-5569]|uniref:hypothetical protein n=1 Tax=Helicobacter sp. MIT 11-5569 TaxID=1548151 RepID=UPI00051FBF77|nr:hypothetical protein [Helicobacter sp. MIT 11-5569]TLD79727.1 hypothetical protein LS70_009675 [Helicobacter sp. MIT 11-5569]